MFFFQLYNRCLSFCLFFLLFFSPFTGTHAFNLSENAYSGLIFDRTDCWWQATEDAGRWRRRRGCGGGGRWRRGEVVKFELRLILHYIIDCSITSLQKNILNLCLHLKNFWSFFFFCHNDKKFGHLVAVILIIIGWWANHYNFTQSGP